MLSFTLLFSSILRKKEEEWRSRCRANRFVASSKDSRIARKLPSESREVPSRIQFSRDQATRSAGALEIGKLKRGRPLKTPRVTRLSTSKSWASKQSGRPTAPFLFYGKLAKIDLCLAYAPDIVINVYLPYRCLRTILFFSSSSRKTLSKCFCETGKGIPIDWVNVLNFIVRKSRICGMTLRCFGFAYN